MFDHSLAVLSAISRTLKKYMNIMSILTQVLFMGYYAYLIVVNVDKLVFLIAYSLIEFLALGILIVNIVTTFTELDYHARKIKAKTKRIIRYFSWAVKATVIGFNIAFLVQGKITQTGEMLLIFSAVFLLLQILLTMTSSITSYYTDLLLYAAKMDYESLVDQDGAEKRPIGGYLAKVTKDMNYRDDINEYSIKASVRNVIKKELEKEPTLKINNRVIKKKKVERIIFHYYQKASKYYLKPSKLNKLLEELKEKHITYLTSDDHLFVLLFFAHNHLTKNYKGLSEYATKLIIGTLLFIADGNDRSVIDLTFKAISKELFDINVWGMLNEGKSNVKEYHDVINIIKVTKEEYKQNREETVLTEFGDIAKHQIAKQINPDTLTGKIVNHFIKKKR